MALDLLDPCDTIQHQPLHTRRYATRNRSEDCRKRINHAYTTLKQVLPNARKAQVEQLINNKLWRRSSRSTDAMAQPQALFQSTLAERERIDHAHQRLILHDLLLCSSVAINPVHNNLWLRGTVCWPDIHPIRGWLRLGFLHLR